MIIDRTTAGDEAHFSECRRFRYLLRRRLPSAIWERDGVRFSAFIDGEPQRIATFCMLNPSKADAFQNDNTVSRCCEFARRWGADVLEVVNLFAFRSPYPEDLRLADERGDDAVNDEVILSAARRSSRFVCAWGNHGELFGRAAHVLAMLRSARVPLWRLGTAQNGSPLHPLARGKSFVPYDREPQEWAA